MRSKGRGKVGIRPRRSAAAQGWVHSLAVSQEEERELALEPLQVPVPERPSLRPRRASNCRYRANLCSSFAWNSLYHFRSDVSVATCPVLRSYCGGRAIAK